MRNITLLLVILLTVSCTSSIHKEIYNNPRKLVAQEDTYSFKTRIGQPHRELEFSGFSGVETCYLIDTKDKSTLKVEMDITKGKFKLIIVLNNGSYKEITTTGDYNFSNGINRIRIAGQSAKGTLKISSTDLDLEKFVNQW